MADRTTAEKEMTRAELAAYLHEVAEAFDGEGEMTISIGNKTVRLAPPTGIDTDVEVGERSAVLGSDEESVRIELTWEPVSS